MKALLAFVLMLATSSAAELMVLHKGGSSLGFYSEEGKLLATVPVGQHPHEMILSPDGKLLYITDNGTMKIEQAGTGGNTVSIVDVQARRKVGEVSLGTFRRPHGIDLDARTGRVAVSTELPDQLLIIDPSARTVVKTYATQGKTSHMVRFGLGATFAYVSNSSSASIAAVNLATGAVKPIGVGERPEGSVLSRDGKALYVACREAATVYAIDTAKNEVSGRIATAKGPVRIAVTPAGMLVYATMHEPGVEIADPKTMKVVGRVPLPHPVVSLNLSPDGRRAYASAEDYQTVYVISVTDRKLLRQFQTAPGMNPDPVIER